MMYITKNQRHFHDQQRMNSGKHGPPSSKHKEKGKIMDEKKQKLLDEIEERAIQCDMNYFG